MKEFNYGLYIKHYQSETVLTSSQLGLLEKETFYFYNHFCLLYQLVLAKFEALGTKHTKGFFSEPHDSVVTSSQVAYSTSMYTHLIFLNWKAADVPLRISFQCLPFVSAENRVRWPLTLIISSDPSGSIPLLSPSLDPRAMLTSLASTRTTACAYYHVRAERIDLHT